MMELDEAIRAAAATIEGADALLITAGAGMGVDSGIPAIRGAGGFVQADDAYSRRGLSYEQLVRPAAYEADPHLAWGFFGRSLQRYRNSQPHAGFAIIRQWVAAMPAGAFVYTSNVDGQFQRAGFDAMALMECHGSAHWLQCAVLCSDHTWAADERLSIDESTGRAADPLPHCTRCGKLARPNIRMFEDGYWVGNRTAEQSGCFEKWKERVHGVRVVVLECGAGSVVPAVRVANEWSMLQLNATLIRINPGEAEVPKGHIGIALGALDALQRIQSALDANYKRLT